MEPIRLKMSALTDENFEALKTAVETLLFDVGFVVDNQGILEKYKEAGAIVDFNNKNVKLPAALVWELVGKAPGAYKIAGINGDSYEIGVGGPLKYAVVTDPFIADYPTGVMRKPSLEDVILNTRIIQSQPDVCTTSLMDYPVTDINGPASRLRAMEAHLLNHAKPIGVYSTSFNSFLAWLDIGKILTRGAPLKGTGLYSVAVAVISPLTLARENCDILLEAIKHNCPIIPTVCPMAGATGPYTFSGTLAMGIAENICVLCTTQLLNPGNPFLFALGISVTEMQTGRDLYYTVDKFLWKIASAEFAKRFNLPTAVETGGAMNSRFDMQSGAEGMLMTLSAMMSGADVIAGAGSCLNANGISAEFILTHYSFLDAAAHLRNGYSMSDIDRSLDSIREQGCGGNFLMDDLTLEKLRDSEFFSHPLFDEACEHGGGISMLERAHAEAQRINESFVSPVPEDIADALKDHFNKLCVTGHGVL